MEPPRPERKRQPAAQVPAAERTPAGRDPAAPTRIEGGRSAQAPGERPEELARRAIREILIGQERRRDRALASGQLLLEFGREIGSAWHWYRDQPGEGGAQRQAAFRDALNAIMANGKSIF